MRRRLGSPTVRLPQAIQLWNDLLTQSVCKGPGYLSGTGWKAKSLIRDRTDQGKRGKLKLPIHTVEEQCTRLSGGEWLDKRSGEGLPERL